MASKSNGKQAGSKDKSNLSFRGWRRENGRVGVRNHVVILPLDDLSNAACEAVANNIKGTMALPHAYGRLQFGADLDLFFRTLIGTGANPNVAAVVVIGIEDGWTKRVVDGIAKTGKPVAGFGIEGHGDIATIAKASHKAKEFLQWASERERETCPIEDLWVSTKCGESDTTTGLASCPTVGNMYDKLIPKGITGVFGETSEITGAEHIAKARAVNAEDRREMDEGVPGLPGRGDRGAPDRQSHGQPADQGQHRRRAHHHRGEGAGQPREDRPHLQIHRGAGAGGGARSRSRPLLHGHLVRRRRVRDADGGRRLRRAHLPDRPGQHHRQSDRPGDQDLPATRSTARTMPEHIDLDVSGILRREMTLDTAGDALIDMIVRTANGRLTAAEALGHREFVMTKLYRSA